MRQGKSKKSNIRKKCIFAAGHVKNLLDIARNPPKWQQSNVTGHFSTNVEAVSVYRLLPRAQKDFV